MAVRSKIEGFLPPRGPEVVKRAVAPPRVPIEEYSRGTSAQGPCPHCGGKVVDREHRQGILDNFLRLVRLRPYRCRRCYHRFYGRAF